MSIVQYSAIKTKSDSRNVRVAIDMALRDNKTFEEASVFYSNGTINGHKVLDQGDAVEVLLASKEGERIKSFGLNKMQLIQALNIVLRSRYEIDKKGKIIGLSKKVQALNLDA